MDTKGNDANLQLKEENEKCSFSLFDNQNLADWRYAERSSLILPKYYITQRKFYMYFLTDGCNIK